MRAVDLSLAGAVVDQEGIGIVLHEAVRKRDRDGARDLWGRGRVAALFRGQRARADAGAVGHARGGAAESERLGSGEAGADLAVEATEDSAAGTGRAVPG